MLRRLLEEASARTGLPGSRDSRGEAPPALLPLPTAPPDSPAGPSLVSSSEDGAGAGVNLTSLAVSITTAAATAHPSADGPGLLALNSSSNSLYQTDNSGDELEYSILAAFSDMETVFLACISTLLPLIVALGIAFGIRHVWRKYRDRRGSGCSSGGLPGYRGVCSRDDTTESLHQPTGQILSAQDLVNGIEGPHRGYYCETEVMEDSSSSAAAAVVVGPSSYASPGSHTGKNANGNIITLTLKNNHLIVETEERAVTMEVPTTRTQYLDNGSCSVIVEVPPGYQNNIGCCAPVEDVDRQQALVHRTDDDQQQQQHHVSSAFDNTKLFGSVNTGLSQSDLSLGSQGSVQNPSYRYGNQLEYGAPSSDYLYGFGASSTTTFKPAEPAKWVEFDKSPDTDRDNAMLGKESREPSQDDSTDSADTTTVLSNPNLVQQQNGTDQLLSKPVITGAILKDSSLLLQEDDTFQEQQRKLGNGTLTPELKRVEAVGSEGFAPSHKRTGSIPPRLLTTSGAADEQQQQQTDGPQEISGSSPAGKTPLDIYSQIKTSTKSILPGGLSPKFERLQNEASPVDDKQS